MLKRMKAMVIPHQHAIQPKTKTSNEQPRRYAQKEPEVPTASPDATAITPEQVTESISEHRSTVDLHLNQRMKKVKSSIRYIML